MNIDTNGYSRMTAVALRQALARGEVNAEAVARAALERIAEREPQIHAWQHLDAKGALAAARAFDARGRPGLLGGVPVGVKDIIATADLPTRYGSPIYEGFRPAADARCVATVRAAGAVVIGKTVTTEFAYFQPGPTANPRNPAHTPGGSSSGSAAAVADGMVPIAFGTQTAGSLIRPASYCGVFALKPGFGAASMEGIKPFSPSLDTLGWLARSADDLELMRCAMEGTPFVPLQRPAPNALRLGVCRTHEWPSADAGGIAAFGQAVMLVGAAGTSLRDVALPAAAAGLLNAQKTVMAYEAARQLDVEWRLHPQQLSAALHGLLQNGRDCSEADYRQALAQAGEGRRTVGALMQGLDALLVPAAPGEAPVGLTATGDPVFSRVWTLLGLPCVNVPGLHGPQGLPIGVQLVGHPQRERDLLAVAARVHHILSNGSQDAPYLA
ncbi:Glutamyl-tRNA(Gln) amidotransferase subunit A [Variovorax sp. PBL-H6]|uniref:amidase n=1 Tax=Variovorax sp. PBL-H6 TaxID=434009 RepID=UPI0013172BEE|nr:amidase [Variovorax sp. PBL-H6]VTU25821.1 Glutamyl-tRNA(Gln) amidotransferase subunit A [Variovorax sp. PBL-H6]